MNRENIIWTSVILVGVLLIGARTLLTERGMGKAYIEPIPQQFVNIGTPEAPEWTGDAAQWPAAFDAIPEADRIEWESVQSSTYGAYTSAMQADPNQTAIRLSRSRTLGVWVAALFTLFIMSFLVRDNPFYKVAESCVVGVSAAYWMVVGFWDMIEPNLMGKLIPSLTWARPDAAASDPEYAYLVPLILGVMLIWRLAPKGGWISRWPMAFIIGVFCGLRLVTFMHADFLSQIRNAIVPLWVLTDGGFDFWESVRNVLLIVGILSCLVYFFFSIEHRGLVGKTARLGIWFLMITFGAAFGYTVMGRIALLAIRLEFLFDDWLWLIDPTGRRVVIDTVSTVMPVFGLG